MRAEVSKARTGASSATCDAHAGGVPEGESTALPSADADDVLLCTTPDCTRPAPPPGAPRALISDPRSREPQDIKATARTLLGAVLGVTLTAVGPSPRRPCGLSSKTFNVGDDEAIDFGVASALTSAAPPPSLTRAEVPTDDDEAIDFGVASALTRAEAPTATHPSPAALAP